MDRGMSVRSARSPLRFLVIMLLVSSSAALLPPRASADSPVRFMRPFYQPAFGGGGSDDGLVVLDFDGDGVSDVAGANESRLDIWLAQPDGTYFGTQQRLLGHCCASDLVAGDFDGDGDPDLAAVAGGLRLLANDGAGSFAAPVTFPEPSSPPAGITVVDVDEDGLDDVLFVTIGGSLTLLRATGAFSFDVTVIATALGNLAWALPVDLDADGHVDIVAASHELIVFTGDGSGAFTESSRYSLDGPAVGNPATGDFDSNGAPDVAVSIAAAGRGIQIWRNDGGGALLPPLSELPNASILDSGDFDGDGRPDIVSERFLDTTALERAIGVELGDGAGGLVSLPATYYGAPDERVIAEDADGDGIDDVFLGDIEEFLHVPVVGDGTLFDAWRTSTVPVTPTGMTTADFNGDGHVDLAVNTNSVNPSRIAIRFGAGDGSFAVGPLLDAGERTDRIVAADFDHDGNDDIAATSAVQTRVFVWISNGDGTFVPHQSFDTSFDPSAMIAGSFNSNVDDHIDLAVALEDAAGVRLFLGTGTGTFVTGSTFSSGLLPRTLASSDFDADGKLDIAVGNYDQGFTRVGFGDGSGNFVAPVDIPADSRRIATGDFDNDGHADLILQRLVLEWVPGDGARGFGTPVLVFAGPAFDGIIAADFNRDGNVDLVTEASPGYNVHAGVGDGSFVSTTVGVRVQTPFAAADFDEDGRVDLATAAAMGPIVNVFLERSHFVGCRRGNVAGAVSEPVPVLFVNDTFGAGLERKLVLTPATPFVIRVDTPPAVSSARFALYAWIGKPTTSTIRKQPFGLGLTCMPNFLTDAPPMRLRKVWNNTGKENSLGAPDLPSTPAPSIPLNRPNGIGSELTVFLQGIIEDPQAQNGIASTTNGILVVSRQ